jgi:mycoredoxin
MNPDLYSRNPSKVTLYGVSWCGDCRRARRVFREADMPYEDIDVDADDQAEAFIIQLNNGKRSVPTIIFPDGSVMVEPSDEALTARLKAYDKRTFSY